MDTRKGCAWNPMKDNRIPPKRAINITLNDDVIREARLYSRDLSRTVEDLLQDFVARERAQCLVEPTVMDQVVDRLNAFHRAHGLLSDEFSSL
jgi:antitoxin CcdA